MNVSSFPEEPEPFPAAWLVALMAWDHDAHAHLPRRTSDDGIPLTPNSHPAVMMAVIRALGEPSPLDVTADELATAARDADLTDKQVTELPAALASFTGWACARRVLEGNPLPEPPGPFALRLLRPEH